MDDGSVNVDYTSPAAAQLWKTIEPIITLMSGKMKQFLGIFGVDEREQLNEETIEEEMPNIQTVKSLITRVQNNMENAVNDGEVEETGEHDTDDLNESKKDIPSLQFYNGVEGCIAVEKFQDCLSCKKIEDISQVTYDGIFSLELK
eukprot:scaffold29456_cov59-Attheya_sp.AAC.5